MAVSGKYGHLNIPGIGDNEPVFVLRAQDKLAKPLIKIYHELVNSHGCHREFREGILEEHKRFDMWGGVPKLPD